MELNYIDEIKKLENIKKYIESSIMINFCTHTKNRLLGMVNNLMELFKIKQDILTNNMGEVSDGYHTFNELYHHRAILFSVICNNYKHLAWKSLHHHDPSQPMYDGMFIVGIDTPNGSATYHYDIEPYWDMFDVQELDKAPEWDGHTPEEAIERIRSLPIINNNELDINDFIGDILDL